jgi:hypothetical protein
MSKRPIQTEAEMAAKVVRWLEADNWTVYQEVDPEGRGGARADIVAVRDEMLTVVEAKTKLGWDVFAQAEHWTRFANRVYMAVPDAKRSDGRSVAFRCAGLLGLGILEVKSLWPIEEDRIQAVNERVEPEYRATINPALRHSLRVEHQTHAKAGTNRGGQWTRFRQTCEAIAAYAKEHPGDTLRACLLVSDHHYTSVSSGIQRLQKIVESGTDLGFELRTDDGAVRVYPKSERESAA